ncbi:MAG TPA: type II toxin-antitoxin system HicA family toxin [Terriglobales bacterium]|nr:type II toxin-antitoxin system HicA family toxin [Terriglobales bacterium]
MGKWPSAKASRVLRALQKNGWQIVRQSGSHITLRHPDCGDYTWPFHDVEIGPAMMAKIGKKTGLKPEDL